jgi:hypothetical protein
MKAASEQTYGLNREAKIRAERKQRNEEMIAVELQPDWPYKSQPFDPEFFGLGEEEET